MAKRKRRSNSDSSRTKSCPTNPFHKFGYRHGEQQGSSKQQDANNEGETKDPVFPTFLSIMELSKQKSTDESKSKMDKVVKELISYLPAITTSSSSSSSDDIDHHSSRSEIEPNQLEASILSATDIVTLLLPWSIKTLLRSSHSTSENYTDDNNNTPWQTLKTCLEFVVYQQQQQQQQVEHNNKASTVEETIKVADILTLGALHKLVPLAIKTALQNSNKNNNSKGKSSQATAATCYCILVDNYYMSPFDSICDSLLPMLDRDDNDIGDGGDDAMDDDDSVDGARFQAMVVSTLGLLHRRLEKANPKKSFQKLITHDVFCVLIKIYRRSANGWQHDSRPIIESLLLHGLFHLEHHMDGFRSIEMMKIPTCAQASNDHMDVDKDKKAKSFHCYQEGLLPMIAMGLSPTHSKSMEDVAAFVGILPIILNCFILQTHVLRDQLNEKAHSKKKASDSLKIVQLQFRFFSVLSTHLVNRLETRGKEGEIMDRASVYWALEQNLRQLLVHDVYLPTMDDKKEVHFQFLSNLGTTIVKKFNSDKSGNRTMANDELKNALACLDVLVQLNHLVLHDALPQVVANCVTSINISNDEELHEEASKFFITLASTYKKLRQLDYFVSSFVNAIDLLKKDQRGESLRALNVMVCDPKVEATLADAIFSSPVNQVKDTFTRLNDHIVRYAGEERSTHKSIDAVVSLLVLILQNVRIEMNTASEIYPLCEAVVNGAVQSIIHSHNSIRSPQSRNGLQLFGHAVALLNKCEFWIDRTSDKAREEASRYAIPHQLFEIFDGATLSTEVGQSVSQELQFLACQYVQRLHSQIQEKQQIMFSSDEAEFSNEQLVATAQKLAHFALQISASEGIELVDVPQKASGLRALADSVSSWAPYVEKKDMVVFLSNLFSCHLLHDISNLGDSVCTRLLTDSEFFEARHVAESLGCALVSCTAALTQKALDSSFKIKKFSSKYLTCQISHSSWTRSTANQLNTVLTTNGASAKGKVVNSEEGKVHLKAASKCVAMLKSLPASIWTETDNCIDSFDLIMRLDLVYRSICEKNDLLQSTAVNILTGLREISSHILQSTSHNTPGTIIGESYTLRNYMQCVASSTQALMAKVDDHGDSYLRLVTSSKRSFGGIAKNAMVQPDALKDISEGLDSIISVSNTSNDDPAKLCTAVLCWAIVKELDLSKNALLVESTADLKRIIMAIFDIALEDFLPNALDDKSTNLILRNESTHIVGELLKFDPEETSDILGGIEAKKSIENSVLKAATKALHSNQVEGGLDYLIGCLAISKPTKSTRISLANGIIKVESTRNPVLETAFSELVTDLDSGSLEALLNDLSSFAARGRIAAFRLRLIHLVVVKLAPTSSLPVVAEYSRRYFMFAIQCMVKHNSTPSDCFDRTVYCAVSLIIDMASNRDVISLRESDIALILCHISSAINILDEPSKEFHAVTTSVYSSCCLMLTFLLQRFPKQLHSCVSLTSGLLVALLQRALHGDFTKSDAKMRCQKYTRLCELLQPHGDVYKKHVLAVLLEYVKALRGNLDPARKNDIMPAIFCLLDILQQYENSQLNSMLDDMGRALLRSTHTNYQRAHVYKGQ
ncbi:unnamed protein product [Cylindrotheca closterium]|uniref:Nucleolar 27S pre-rRNA processing Urb2/Npa2 C-terminal domain-containing protein n=1 Tax=Cylindrotheca closterium TaxID=2856 RepID=A0AAD2JP98_9STRA|nr:unnamed protein product [Cylindrotheca closterium]